MTGDGLPAAPGPGGGAKPELRASDEDRERVVERLRVAAGDGRLTAAELDERLGAALTARTSRELAALTADLPEAGGIAARAKDVVRLDYKGGNATRRGRWIVPQRMEIRAVGGTVKLDFTDAVITVPTLHIQAEVRGGRLVLVTRPGIEVDADDVGRGGRKRQGAAGKRLEGTRQPEGRDIRQGPWRQRGRSAAAPDILAVVAAQARAIPRVSQRLMPRTSGA